MQVKSQNSPNRKEQSSRSIQRRHTLVHRPTDGASQREVIKVQRNRP
jgi:hypothetical protein